ncbi:MAG TPA: ABC transporter permease [Puia sp.]|nr:ABC transporter permease [Puia sp.]
MLANYFKIALRNLRRNRVFSAINILGLAVGLAACLLIAAYVRDETHYDRFPKRSADIYRVNLGVSGTTHNDYPMVDVAVGPGMAAAFPEIEACTRLTRAGEVFAQYGTRQFKETRVVFVDSNFFSLFTLPFLEGDAQTALTQTNSLVVTKTFATKYFGDEPALGKTIDLQTYGPCRITGVIDKIPDGSHFHFDVFISFNTLHIKQYTWSNVGFYTYLLLRPHTDPKKLQARFPQLVAKYAVPEIARDMGIPLAEAGKATGTFVFSLTPLSAIHLHSDTKYELEANGNSRYILIFSALAVFILLLACANFTNLSTAGAAGRGREIGIRKVMGSLKTQLRTQFLVESILLTAFSMLLAFLLVFLLLPLFNQVAGKQLSFISFLSLPALLAATALTILVGTLAGIYPAFFLSSFNPIRVLKGVSVLTNRKSMLRSGLVVFQFVVSIALIVATLVVYRQLHYMQDKRLGYDKDQVLYIQDANLLGTNQEAFRQHLLLDKRVVDASLSWCVPGTGNMNGTEIYPRHDDESHGGEIHTNIFQIDYDYIPTLGLQLVRGRNFARSFPTDSTGVLINEAAVNDLGWAHTDPIGKTIVRSGRTEYHVIGVVRDFHYISVKEKIAPLMLLLGNNRGGILVKVGTTDIENFLSDTKKQWASFSPAGPFSYYFLDDQFATLYVAEQRTGRLFSAFTVIAILIAGLGLFGLAAYMVEQRTREIGIRKVLGASISSVLLLVSNEFLLLVGLAFLIAVPLAWWGMQQWLQEFAYRTTLAWWIFPIAGIAALILAMITISTQAVRAATANPIDSLRNE